MVVLGDIGQLERSESRWVTWGNSEKYSFKEFFKNILFKQNSTLKNNYYLSNFSRWNYAFRVAVILCGGNIDSNILGRCIEKSLVVDGRMLKFSTLVSDRPGGVSELCKILASLGASVKHIEHERAWLTSEVFQVIVSIWNRSTLS